jgi:phenylalanyl-tRNA synthetase beta chain
VKASHRWLRELVPALAASPAEIAARLTNAGLEVEALTDFGAASRAVVVARVEKIEPHPARAKLRLVTVDAGRGPERVVCGAPNVPDPGGFVVLARNGTHLPAKNMTLEPKDIGGVVSEGMLCSEAELGLRASGDAGILVLQDAGAALGKPLTDLVPEAADTIFEIGLTPNRPDGLGHVGLARELAALFGLPFSIDVAAPSRTSPETVESRVSVEMTDLERCPLYGAALVEGVSVAPSPLGLAYRLESLGVRSISNVVDVTNIVMLKWGHPIHGFDFSLVRGGKIVVRRARDGEELETLDGAKRKLVEDDLVIADASGPVALAGVMGGQGSELRSETRDVLVECAYFTSRGIRRAARRHGMHTESSHRFERGVDPLDIARVLRDTARLLVELAGGTARSTFPIFGEPPPRPARIRIRKAKTDALLGIDVSLAETRSILERLGCAVEGAADASALGVDPPSHRPDLRLEEDLVEEIVRVHGIDRVPSIVPPIVPQLHDLRSAMSGAVRRAAVDVGLSEALTMGFVSPAELAAVGAPPSTFPLLNPLSEERSVMRTSLLPGLVEAARRAKNHGVSDVRLFSIGARFLPDASSKLACEAPSFAAILTGHRETPLGKPTKLDIYDAKGVAIEIVERATRQAASVASQKEGARSPALHPRGAADVVVGAKIVGRFGPLHPNVARATDIGIEAFVIELDLDVLEGLGTRTPRYRPIPTLPAATRDIALVVHDDVLAATVAEAIREAGGDLCESAAVFDVFRGGSVPEDHRSLAYHVVYRDPRAASDPASARTLTDAEVDERHAAVVTAVTERFGAVIRA